MKETKNFYVKNRNHKEYKKCSKKEYEALGNKEWERTTRLDYILQSAFYSFIPSTGTLVNSSETRDNETKKAQKVVNRINWVKKMKRRKISSSKVKYRLTFRKGRYIPTPLTRSQLMATPLGNFLTKEEMMDISSGKERRTFITNNRLELKERKLDYITNYGK
ncbi:hypothetical protein KAU11_10605 [Candidatus Babeliales bacterium]|nr:hypothetical protein [Candidatus Babeliales bacterium]